jgi:hypothetical protein
VKTHDYVHYYRGYWSDGAKCRIRIYRTHGDEPVVICSQLPENKNTSVTNKAEYLAAEVIEEHELATPLTWIEHFPEHRGKPSEYSLVTFSSWERREMHLGGVWRWRVGSPQWSPWHPLEVQTVLAEDASARPRSSPAKARDFTRTSLLPSVLPVMPWFYRGYRG